VRGWWIILGAMGFFIVSSIVTYMNHDFIEMYRLMGYPEAQIEQIKKTGLLAGNAMPVFTICCWFPILGYILFVKKYMKPKQ